MESLAEELIITFLSFLDPKSLIQVRQLSRKYYNLSYDDVLWKTVCNKSNIEFKQVLPGKNWEWVTKSQVFKPQPEPSAVGTAPHCRGVYAGDWLDSQPHGYGFYKDDWCTYIGQWSNGKTEGVGKMIYVDGESLEGIYANGEPVKAIKHYKNGDIYDGEWREKMRNGYGEYKWIVGDRYVGNWEHGNLHGNGTYYWSDKRTYVGNWVNHNQEGFGIFEWPDGHKYEGNWQHGKRHGQGKLTKTTKMTNGNVEEIIYEGEFHQDLTTSAANDVMWDNFFNLSFDKQRIFIIKMKTHPTYTYKEIMHLIS